MAEELLEKIPPEKRWAITAKALTRFIVMRGSNIMSPILGKGEGIISPLWGLGKIIEINNKIWGRGGRKLFPWVKEKFNIPVEDAIGAVKLLIVAATLNNGPEFEYELVEATPERAVIGVTRCPWMERYKEFEMDTELAICDKGSCQAWNEEGLKAINPKITHMLPKAQPRGDPYCEGVIEFKEE